MVLIEKIVLQLYLPCYQNWFQGFMYENSMYVFSMECFSYCFMCLITSVVRMPESFGTTAYGWSLFPNESCFEQY